ncbi:MAG: Maf family protein [Blastocatellia bacterium]|nr:Maf family protein [Blastocatellia bacterium]
MKLILASGSPRRAEIMRAAGYTFEISVADVDETPLLGENPADYVVRLARTKAAAIAAAEPSLVVGADTTVVVDNEILAKPLDPEDAARMLRALSGRSHEVLTGVAVFHTQTGALHSGLERSTVWFDQLPENWIAEYVASGEPMDKAGAYAIQGRAALYIDRIEGNYLNIVGLPLPLVRRLLAVATEKNAG